jgi:hypothetical protein
MTSKPAALAVLSVLILSSVVLAHHGTSLYEMNREITLKGTIKEWSFGNPHTWLWLNVTASDGKAEEWSIESAPPTYLAGQGWSAATLKPGEEITALVSPRRGEARSGILLEVHRKDGEVLMVRPRGSFGRPRSVD